MTPVVPAYYKPQGLQILCRRMLQVKCILVVPFTGWCVKQPHARLYICTTLGTHSMCTCLWRDWTITCVSYTLRVPLKSVQLGYKRTCIVLANLKTKAAASIDCEASSSVSSTPVEALAPLLLDVVSRTASNWIEETRKRWKQRVLHLSRKLCFTL